MVQNIKNDLDSNEGVETESVLSEIEAIIKEVEDGGAPADESTDEKSQENEKLKYFFISLNYDQYFYDSSSGQVLYSFFP